MSIISNCMIVVGNKCLHIVKLLYLVTSHGIKPKSIALCGLLHCLDAIAYHSADSLQMKRKKIDYHTAIVPLIASNGAPMVMYERIRLNFIPKAKCSSKHFFNLHNQQFYLLTNSSYKKWTSYLKKL